MKPLEKLARRIKESKSLVSVGLDSEVSKLPERFKNVAKPQFEFNKWIIEQTHEHVAAYKPNMAFYEAQGSSGWEQLQMTMDYLAKFHSDIFTICDAKRADIDSTNKGYVTAIFDRLRFDAITLHPYLGKEALEPFLERDDKVSIILCKTSNSGSGEFQDLEVDGRPLWQMVATQVAEKWNQHNNCMLVVGATYPTQLKQIRKIVGEMTLLIPGIGVQGGNLELVVKNGINSEKAGLIINSARGVIFSVEPGQVARDLKESINAFR